MSTPFIRELWLRRIWESQVRRGDVHGIGEEIRVAMDYAAILGIETIVGWLNKRGFTLEFAKKAGGIVNPKTRKITISSHATVQKQLHMLLHECGHILIATAAEDKYPNGYKKIDEALEGRGELHKIDILGEEFEAWQKGKKLAIRLGIRIDLEEFDKTRARCLKSYIRWASRRGRVADE